MAFASEHPVVAHSEFRPVGDIERSDARFEVVSPYEPAGDQPAAIAELEKRINEVAQSLERGDTAQKARELAVLANRVEGNVGDLVALRSVLAELRRHADAIRVGSPA